MKEDNTAAVEAAKLVKQTGDNFVDVYNKERSSRLSRYAEARDFFAAKKEQALKSSKIGGIATTLFVVAAATAFAFLVPPVALVLAGSFLISGAGTAASYLRMVKAGRRANDYNWIIGYETEVPATSPSKVSRAIHESFQYEIDPKLVSSPALERVFKDFVDSLKTLSKALPTIAQRNTHLEEDKFPRIADSKGDSWEFYAAMISDYNNLIEAAKRDPDVRAILDPPTPTAYGAIDARDMRQPPLNFVSPRTMTLEM